MDIQPQVQRADESKIATGKTVNRVLAGQTQVIAIESDRPFQPTFGVWAKLTDRSGSVGADYTGDIYETPYDASPIVSGVAIRNEWEREINAAYENTNVSSVLRLPLGDYVMYPVHGAATIGGTLTFLISERPEPTCSGSGGTLDGGSL